MKGLELPINMIVVIAIAVLVLVVVAALFGGQLMGGDKTFQINSAYNQGCNSLRTVFGCDQSEVGRITTSYKETASSTAKSLLEVCGLKDPALDNNPQLCARSCGCNV